MPTSIADQVKEYLISNPGAGNKELYITFPNVRKNTLRHYRSKFAAVVEQAIQEKKVEAALKRGRPKKLDSELEARVGKLEKQMEQLLVMLDVQIGKPGRRVNPIDRRFKEMEEMILKFLKSKSQSMPADLAKLEELQKLVAHKILGFINNLKGK